MKLLFTMMMAAAPGAALAGNNVALASDVFVERIERDAAGRQVTSLAPPRRLSAGDRLVFILSFRNRGAEPASDFVLTNPVPDSVAFAGTEDEAAEVSVDGGRSWGRLGSLLMPGSDRPAQAADVTHIRWSVRQALAAGASGKVSYRAVAR